MLHTAIHAPSFRTPSDPISADANQTSLNDPADSVDSECLPRVDIDALLPKVSNVPDRMQDGSQKSSLYRLECWEYGKRVIVSSNEDFLCRDAANVLARHRQVPRSQRFTLNGDCIRAHTGSIREQNGQQDGQSLQSLTLGDRLELLGRGNGDQFDGKSPTEIAELLQRSGLKEVGVIKFHGGSTGKRDFLVRLGRELEKRNISVGYLSGHRAGMSEMRMNIGFNGWSVNVGILLGLPLRKLVGNVPERFNLRVVRGNANVEFHRTRYRSDLLEERLVDRFAAQATRAADQRIKSKDYPHRRNSYGINRLSKRNLIKLIESAPKLKARILTLSQAIDTGGELDQLIDVVAQWSIEQVRHNPPRAMLRTMKDLKPRNLVLFGLWVYTIMPVVVAIAPIIALSVYRPMHARQSLLPTDHMMKDLCERIHVSESDVKKVKKRYQEANKILAPYRDVSTLEGLQKYRDRVYKPWSLPYRFRRSSKDLWRIEVDVLYKYRDLIFQSDESVDPIEVAVKRFKDYKAKKGLNPFSKNRRLMREYRMLRALLNAFEKADEYKVLEDEYIGHLQTKQIDMRARKDGDAIATTNQLIVTALTFFKGHKMQASASGLDDHVRDSIDRTVSAAHSIVDSTVVPAKKMKKRLQQEGKVHISFHYSPRHATAMKIWQNEKDGPFYASLYNSGGGSGQPALDAAKYFGRSSPVYTFKVQDGHEGKLVDALLIESHEPPLCGKDKSIFVDTTKHSLVERDDFTKFSSDYHRIPGYIAQHIEGEPLDEVDHFDTQFKGNCYIQNALWCALSELPAELRDEFLAYLATFNKKREVSDCSVDRDQEYRVGVASMISDELAILIG